MLEPIHIAALHHQYSVLDYCYTLHTIAILVTFSPSVSVSFSITFLSYVFLKIVTSLGETPDSPIISFAYIPILIFSVKTKL